MMRVLSTMNGTKVAPAQWDHFVAQDPRGHLLQTWAWGELKQSFGWTPVRTGIERDGALVAGAQVLYRRMGPVSVGYIPKGPVILDGDEIVMTQLWQAIGAASRRMRAVSLKVEPEWYDEELARHQDLRRWGLSPSLETIQPRRTIVVDLNAPAEQILARMKAKWRYNIGLSQRKGVQVRAGTSADLAAFYRLMQITGQRDRFDTHTLDYYRRALELFWPEGRAQLLLASHEGQVLAGLVAYAFNGQAWYMYGASSSEKRELMPNHQLQWSAMRWARECGCLRYDLWGIPDTDAAAPTEGLGGVQRFKEGFGGQIVRYVGAYDLVYAPVLDWLKNRVWAWRRRRAASTLS